MLMESKSTKVCYTEKTVKLLFCFGKLKVVFDFLTQQSALPDISLYDSSNNSTVSDILLNFGHFSKKFLEVHSKSLRLIHGKSDFNYKSQLKSS